MISLTILLALVVGGHSCSSSDVTYIDYSENTVLHCGKCREATSMTLYLTKASSNVRNDTDYKQFINTTSLIVHAKESKIYIPRATCFKEVTNLHDYNIGWPAVISYFCNDTSMCYRIHDGICTSKKGMCQYVLTIVFRQSTGMFVDKYIPKNLYYVVDGQYYTMYADVHKTVAINNYTSIVHLLCIRHSKQIIDVYDDYTYDDVTVQIAGNTSKIILRGLTDYKIGRYAIYNATHNLNYLSHIKQTSRGNLFIYKRYVDNSRVLRLFNVIRFW